MQAYISKYTYIQTNILNFTYLHTYTYTNTYIHTFQYNRLCTGSKDIFHLEAFGKLTTLHGIDYSQIHFFIYFLVAKFMAIYKKWLISLFGWRSRKTKPKTRNLLLVITKNKVYLWMPLPFFLAKPSPNPLLKFSTAIASK